MDASTFADPDRGDTVTITTSTLPTWLSFNHDTMTFSGTPQFEDAGHWAITVFATNNHGATSEIVYSLEIEANPEPVIMQNTTAGWTSPSSTSLPRWT